MIGRHVYAASGRAFSWLAIVAVTLACGLLVAALGAAPVSGSRAIPFALVLITCAGVLAWERYTQQISLFSPLVSVVCAYAILFGAIPVADMWFDNPIAGHAGWGTASWAAWIGLLVLYAGFVLGRRCTWRHSPQRSRTWHAGTARSVAVVLMSLAVVSVLVELWNVGGISDYLAHFGQRHHTLGNPVPTLIRVSLATPAVLLIAGNWVVRPSLRRAATLFLLWTPAALLVSGYLGQRWRDLAIVLALVAIAHLGRRKIPGTALLVFGVVLLSLFVGAFLYRNVVGTDRTAKTLAGDSLYFNYLATNEFGQFRAFVLTTEAFPAVAPFQRGGTFLSIIPGTPYPTGGYLFTSTVYPSLAASGVSYSNSLLGELYMNFGWSGIFWGMGLFGALLGMIESFWRSRHGSIGALLIYSYCFVPAAGVLRGDFTTFVGYSLVALVPLIIALPAVERPERQPSEQQPTSAPNQGAPWLETV